RDRSAKCNCIELDSHWKPPALNANLVTKPTQGPGSVIVARLEFSWIVARRQRFIGCELLQTGDDCFDKRPLFHASVGAFFVGTGLAIGLLFMGSAAKQARYLDGRRAKLEWRRNRST